MTFSKAASSYTLVICFFVTCASAAAEENVIPWDLEALSKPPQTFPTPDFAAVPGANPEVSFTGEGVTTLFYEGLPWQGKPTRVFACYGLPEHKPGEKVPGMVLAHGGGGTAFDEWVRIWNRRGYAAIAMDLTGTVPGGEPGKRPRHEYGGPENYGDRKDADWPTEDQWPYHAVADIVLAHSLLRSLPGVDPERIGLTGISWGGFLTCIVSGVDTRFRFAIPVYGCGYVGESPGWRNMWKGIGEERSKKWQALWNPSLFLPRTTMPTLWVNGANDVHFPLITHAKSFALPQGPKTLCVRVGMQHSHVHGWQPEEIYIFADSIIRGGAPLAAITGERHNAAETWVTFDAAVPIKRADFIYAKDLKDWFDAEWITQEAALDTTGKRASATIPEDCRAYFFNLTDERGLVVSTPNVQPAK